MATADYSPQAQTLPTSTAPASPSESAALLRRNLERLAARRNRQILARAVMVHLGFGLGIAALLMLAYRLYLLDFAAWIPLLPIGAALLLGLWRGQQARRSAFEAASDADHQLGLRDQLSSALAFAYPELVKREFARRGAVKTSLLARLKLALRNERPVPTRVVASQATDFVPFLVSQAATRSQAIDAKKLYPWKFDRAFLWLMNSAVLLLMFCVMPNQNWFLSPQQIQDAQALKAPGEELQAIAKVVRDKKDVPEAAESKQLAKRMSALGQRMARGRIGKRDAMLQMGDLKRDLERAAKSQANPAAPNMEQAEKLLREQPMQSEEGRQMQQELQNNDVEKAAQQLEKLAQKLETGKMSADEKQKVANDLEKAAQALRQQGGPQNEAAAKQLEQAAKDLKQGNQPQGKGAQQQQNPQGQKQGQGQKQQQSGQQSGQQQQGGQGQKQAQKNEQQQGQQGGQQGGQQQGSGQQSQGQQGAGGADALRKMAQGMRQGGTPSGNSQALREMLNKMNQAEKDAGQNSGQQSGQGGSSGQAQGQGEGKSMTPGKDLQASDPHGQVGGGGGLGRRDHATGVQKGGGVSKLHTKSSGDKRRWADVWSDRLPKTKQKIDRVTGKMGQNGETEQLPTRGEGKGGSVKTPYYDVYESYKKDAEDAVSKETVPPAYRRPVKEYFESLKP